jgi:hypothetical protein
MSKRFRLDAAEILPVATGRGRCFASDMITVDGKKVGFMYRQEASQAGDSGWTFLSGKETQDYLDNPDHIEIYDVNTIANYDVDIIPLLDSPPGTAFERERGTGKFMAADSPPPE